MTKTRIGIVGCGNIVRNYLTNAKKFAAIEIIRLADLIEDRATTAAKEFGIPRTGTTEQLLADPDVDIVLNLTPPWVHAEVALQAIEAGKHVYNEKPLSITREDGQRVLQRAQAKGVRVGGAPDTFFGAGHQTARKLIDDGAIGRPVSALAFMMGRGPDQWHPEAENFYKPGAGPMFDMGPYYVTALLNMLGPVKRVSGMAGIQVPQRTIGSEPRKGQTFQVTTPDHVVGLLEFASGAIGTLVTSFATMATPPLPRILVCGTEGTLEVPDPNGFDGTVRILKPGEKEWKDVPHTRAPLRPPAPRQRRPVLCRPRSHARLSPGQPSERSLRTRRRLHPAGRSAARPPRRSDG